jgi:hypothetical protein
MRSLLDSKLKSETEKCGNCRHFEFCFLDFEFGITPWFPYGPYACGRTGNTYPNSAYQACSAYSWSLNSFSACSRCRRAE